MSSGQFWRIGNLDPLRPLTAPLAYRTSIIANALRRVLLPRNYRDFEELHYLILQADGYHPVVLIVRRDNDPTRDLTPRAIVRAAGNLMAAGAPVADSFQVLNHWR